MNALEIKVCLKYGIPVIYTDMDGVDMHFDYISAVIYRPIQNHLVVSLELTSIDKHSITIALSDRVRAADSERLAVLISFEHEKPGDDVIPLDPRTRGGVASA